MMLVEPSLPFDDCGLQCRPTRAAALAGAMPRGTIARHELTIIKPLPSRVTSIDAYPERSNP
jgi:hypothetical protein